MPDLHTELLLFRRIANGDEPAFRELFDGYRTHLFSLVLQMTSSAVVAEEIVQDVFLKIWVNRQVLADIAKPGSYIFILARNKVMDYLRKVAADRRMLAQFVELSAGQTSYGADDKLNVRMAQELIDEAVGELSPLKQQIYNLSRKQGWSNDQIAAHLQLSRSRVANSLSEIMKHLRSRLSSFLFFL